MSNAMKSLSILSFQCYEIIFIRIQGPFKIKTRLINRFYILLFYLKVLIIIIKTYIQSLTTSDQH